MVSILFGLQTTLVGRFGKEGVIPPATKCNNKDAFFKATGACITLGFVDNSFSLENRTTNWRTLQIFAKHVGWTMSDTVGDTSKNFDIVYFGSSRDGLTYARVNTTTFVKYLLTHDRDSQYINFNAQSPLNYYAQVGGPPGYDMGNFGFQSYVDNPEQPTVYWIQNKLSDAYIAYRQALTTGLNWDQVPFPKIDLPRIVLPSKSYGNSGDSSGFNTDMFWIVGGPLIIWSSLFASQLYLSSQINEDRRKKLRLGMVMMGLNTGAYQVSWFLYHILLSAIYSAIVIGIGHACKFTFFTHVNPAIIFLLYWTTSWAAIGFTMMTTSLVHHPTGHTALMVSMFLIGIVLASLTSNTMGDFYSIFWPKGSYGPWAFNYPFQFGSIMAQIALYIFVEGGSGNLPGQPTVAPYFRWSRIYMKLDGTIMPTISSSFGFLILCGLMGLIVSIYLEIVFPREIGSPQGFGFFFLPSYWGFDTASRLNVETVVHRADKMSDIAVDLDPDVQAEYNDVMSRLSACDPTLALAVTKVSKMFQKKRKSSEQDTRAVDGVTLGADTGSVLGIVGHNGAGKTTLMSMLCGVVGMSTGDARIFGHSVSQNMASIHSIMGVCPQEDVLWPELTPYEHLKLFAILKRIPWSDHKRVIADSLVEVGLYEVRHRITNKLSGGMKRRLSVAVALIGNVKILMLDEPTAGLDPRNRLEIWSIIERIKLNRVVILTTHSMLEAASLADKIAIMAVGRLRAVGSPQHLVQRFGKGHQINLITKISKNEEVKSFMGEILPDATLEVDTGARLTYSLASSRSRLLPDFCKLMESPEYAVLLEDWGISQTTLEQVFLRLTHGGGNQDGLHNAAALQLNVAIEGSDDVLGFVAILPATTLDETRELMLENENFPKDFTFLINRAPVTRAQERTTSAYRSLPTIEIRLGNAAANMDVVGVPPRNGRVSPGEDVRMLKERIVDLEAQVADRNQLAARVVELQKEIDGLKEQIRAFKSIQ